MCGIFSIFCMFVTSHPTLILGNLGSVVCVCAYMHVHTYVCVIHYLPQSTPVFQHQQSPTKLYKPVTFQMLQTHSFFLKYSTASNCCVCFLEFFSIYLLKSISFSSISLNKSTSTFQNLTHYFSHFSLSASNYKDSKLISPHDYELNVL